MLWTVQVLGTQVATAVWLVEHLTGEGVPEAQRHLLTARVFAMAALIGDLPLLQLLRQRGCPWDETAWEYAAEGGCVAVLEWLHEGGCPKPVRMFRFMRLPMSLFELLAIRLLCMPSAFAATPGFTRCQSHDIPAIPSLLAGFHRFRVPVCCIPW